MYGFRERVSGCASARRATGSLGGTLVSILTVIGITGAASGCSLVASQSERSGGLGLEPAPFVEPNYVLPIDEAANASSPIPEGEDFPAPPPEPLAAIYSERYGINDDLALTIVEHALAEGIDPELAFRLIRVESVFRPTARSPLGALGLVQLMPGTARSVDRSLRTERDILEPSNNLRVGFRYLRGLIERYDDVRLGLLAYNRGSHAVDRALRRGVDPENGYSHKVLGTRGSNPYDGPGVIPPITSASDG